MWGPKIVCGGAIIGEKIRHTMIMIMMINVKTYQTYQIIVDCRVGVRIAGSDVANVVSGGCVF